MPDNFKKVHSGDPMRIPAQAYNAFIDAAEAHKRNMVLPGGRGRGAGVSGTVISAYNPTATDIPWRSAVEILSTEEGAEITVGKPGDAAGTGVYAISLEPIPSEMFGAVALAGGPWKLAVADEVTPGDQVGPVDDAWMAALAGTATWEVLRAEDADGVALVRFLGGGQACDGAPVMIVASSAMPSNDVNYPCHYLSGGGVQGDALVCKRPYGIYILSGAIGFLGQDALGNNTFLPANMRREGNMPLVVEVRTDDPTPVGSIAAGRIWFRSDVVT